MKICTLLMFVVLLLIVSCSKYTGSIDERLVQAVYAGGTKAAIDFLEKGEDPILSLKQI